MPRSELSHTPGPFFGPNIERLVSWAPGSCCDFGPRTSQSQNQSISNGRCPGRQKTSKHFILNKKHPVEHPVRTKRSQNVELKKNPTDSWKQPLSLNIHRFQASF